jgi:hypothetical protein
MSKNDPSEICSHAACHFCGALHPLDSSYSLLVRVIAWILHFICNCRTQYHRTLLSTGPGVTEQTASLCPTMRNRLPSEELTRVGPAWRSLTCSVRMISVVKTYQLTGCRWEKAKFELPTRPPTRKISEGSRKGCRVRRLLELEMSSSFFKDSILPRNVWAWAKVNQRTSACFGQLSYFECITLSAKPKHQIYTFDWEN